LALQEIGDLEGAEAAFRKAIEYAPRLGPAHGNLAHLVKFRERDDHMRAMEALLAEPGMSPEHKASVLFGLAKAYDDLKDYAKSFEFLHEANRLKRSLLDLDLTIDFEANRKLIETLDDAFFDVAEPAGDPSAAPIFIVGMARSGTTLVEQILSSHSQVHGAGELIYLQRMFGDWMQKVSSGSFPRRASMIPRQELRRLGAQYLAKLRRHSATAAFITDKMPFNFRFVGFLRLILPNAKVIHCMRDPLDICISSYKRLFSNGVFYSYNLRELGLFYNSYRSLMTHWRTALPGTMFEIQYEDLVANQEERTRELLAYCGLPWEDGCLNFHENERAVRTASLAQVRQPIYKTSVASSRKYFPYIGPLLETLGVDADKA
jgi:tetratricopeptide (TPR) repeat protein